MAGTLGIISGVVGLGKSLMGGSGASPAANAAAGALTYSPPVSQTQAGAFNPPSGSGIAYNYIPTGASQVDTGTQGQISGAQQVATDWRSLLPAQVQQALAMAGNNQSHANVAGGVLTDLGAAEINPLSDLRTAAFNQLPWTPALQAVGAGQQAVGAGQQQVGVGLQGQGLNFGQQVLQSLPQFQQILSQGLDPRGAAYDQAQHNTTEQTNAQLARMGLGNSGAGAGIANQANSNFNIDWQNQQLARALSALQGYSGAMTGAGQQLGSAAGVTGTGGNIVGTGANIVQGGANQIAQGQTMQGNAFDQINTVNTMGRQGATDISTGGQLPLQASAMGSALPASIYGSYLGGSDPNLARALQYLQDTTSSSKVANDAAGAQVGSNATQNAGAQAALAPLLQGGFNWLQGLFNTSGQQQQNIGNLSASDLAFLTGQGGNNGAYDKGVNY